MTTPTTASRSRARMPSAPMNRAVIVVPASRPMTGETPTTIAPAAPVNPSSARAWTANDIVRATTNRLTTPATMAMTMPAAIAFWTKS